jgi:hypothetical protein
MGIGSVSQPTILISSIPSSCALEYTSTGGGIMFEICFELQDPAGGLRWVSLTCYTY